MRSQGDLQRNVPQVPPGSEQDGGDDGDGYEDHRCNVHAHHLVRPAAVHNLPGEGRALAATRGLGKGVLLLVGFSLYAISRL